MRPGLDPEIPYDVIRSPPRPQDPGHTPSVFPHTSCFYLVGSHLQEVDFPTTGLSGSETDGAIRFPMFDYPRNDLWIKGNGPGMTYLALSEVHGGEVPSAAPLTQRLSAPLTQRVTLVVVVLL